MIKETLKTFWKIQYVCFLFEPESEEKINISLMPDYCKFWEFIAKPSRKTEKLVAMCLKQPQHYPNPNPNPTIYTDQPQH